MNKLAPAYAYLRVSHISQAKEVKDGFTRQAVAISKYVKANRYHIVKTFEEAIAGTKENRPELARLIFALEKNGIKTVIIEKLERLARDLMVQEAIIKDFRKAGVTLISALEGPDLLADDPTRKLIRQIFGGIAEYEKAMLVLKLRAARDRKRARGERAEGRKPFGDTEEERNTLTYIKHLRGSRGRGGPGLTLPAIVKRLNEEGVQTKSGRPWNPALISYHLNRQGRKTRPPMSPAHNGGR